MTIRALNLPKDFAQLEHVLNQTFQYPENPEWSIQPDDKEDIARMIKMLRRLWPIIRSIQAVSPSLRDMLRGFVWEEGNQIGGSVILQRNGTTNTWQISVVGVLPEFRRRGLARKLLTRTLADLRQRGAKRVVLSVIDKNIPAYELYKSLGFEHYSSSVAYHHQCDHLPEERVLPDGFEEIAMSSSDWRVCFQLEEAIAPVTIVRYEPVEIGQFRPHIAMHMLEPVMDRLLRLKQERLLYRRDGQVIGYLTHRTPRSGKGTSSIIARLNPVHAEMAPYMLAKAMRAVMTVNPTLRIHCSAPAWMSPIVDAAKEFGFTEHVRYHKLGLIP